MRFSETFFVLFYIVAIVSARQHNCTTTIILVNNQNYVSCVLSNIKFVGLEEITINVNRIKVPEATTLSTPKEAAVDGSINVNRTEVPGATNPSTLNGTAVNGSINVTRTEVPEATTHSAPKETAVDGSINMNRTEVPGATTPSTLNETAVNGSISSGHERQLASEVDIDSLVLQVKFKSSKIAVVPNVIFFKFQSLQIFDASDSQVRSLNALTFNNAANLLMIFLYNNQLTSITSYVFVHTKNLEVLDLSSNHISRIDNLAFTSLGKLKRLSLSNNRIKSLDDYTFQPLKSLKWIWLENNQMSMISSDLFTVENRDLYGIFVKNNAIDSISYFVLDKLPSLRFLDLSGNRCTGNTFKNHAIKDNASIKFELHGCHQNHRKMKFSSDQKHDISFSVNSAMRSFEQCLADVQKIMMTTHSIES